METNENKAPQTVKVEDEYVRIGTTLFRILNQPMMNGSFRKVRNVLQQCWKLKPAPNTLSYSTYQISVLPGQKYSASSKKVGRFYTVTREKLKDYR